MAHQIARQFAGLSPNVRSSLPSEAEIVEFCEDGGIICREPSPDIDPSRKEPVIDPETGKQAVREYETGQGTFRTKLWRWPEEETRLVKFEPRRTGRVVRNFDFQESEAERERRERQRKVEEFQEDLAVEAVDAGLTVSQLVQMLQQGDANVEGGDTVAPEAADAEAGVQTDEADLEELLDAEEGVEGHEDYELTMARPGVWIMPDGEEFPAEGTADKSQAVAHIAEEYGEGIALQVTQGEAES